MLNSEEILLQAHQTSQKSIIRCSWVSWRTRYVIGVEALLWHRVGKICHLEINLMLPPHISLRSRTVALIIVLCLTIVDHQQAGSVEPIANEAAYQDFQFGQLSQYGRNVS